MTVLIVFYFEYFSHVPLYARLGTLKQINKTKRLQKKKNILTILTNCLDIASKIQILSLELHHLSWGP